MFRIERITDYKLNGQSDISIVLETPDLREATDKMHELALVPHFGKYQIIEEVYVTNEYAQGKKSAEVNRTEHNKVEQETSPGLPLGPQNRSSES